VSGRTFAALLLLRRAADHERILAVLQQERRTAVQEELKAMANLTPVQIQQRLKKDREEQLKAQRWRAEQRLGCRLDHAHVRLVAWLGRPFQERAKESR
jgi:hypothetical protein